MHDPEKSDSGIVAMKPMNKAGATGGGVGGAKAGDQGKRGPTKHAPDAEPGSCDPGVGPRTKSCKAKQEGAVHFAPPSHRKGSSARVSPIRSATVVCFLRGNLPTIPTALAIGIAKNSLQEWLRSGTFRSQTSSQRCPIAARDTNTWIRCSKHRQCHRQGLLLESDERSSNSTPFMPSKRHPGRCASVAR